MKVRRKKAFYSISAVAKMFSVHQQTIRLYEKQGFISPKRSAGNTRLFAEEDVDRLEEIIYLTHQLRINLAGVEMILKLKKQIDTMQKHMNKLFDDTQKELEKESEVSKVIARESAEKLLSLRKHPEPPQQVIQHTDDSDSSENPGAWEIEYDEE
ncbi:MAG TPA: MerR family transcriptional regulator [Candidatus Babeliales bacterium]|jgi:MerR family transcriptional regulator/heat shock protein HspR|nr:MerR family transcriptional regulator [Candidatus Babeliales bacterium]